MVVVELRAIDQSPAGSYPGSRALEQAPVEDALRRDDQWGEGSTMKDFGPQRECAARFQRFDRENSDHFDSGENWRGLKMPILTFDSDKKDGLLSYQWQVKVFDRGHGFKKVLTREQPDVDVMADGANMWSLEARFGYEIVQESMKA